MNENGEIDKLIKNCLYQSINFLAQSVQSKTIKDKLVKSNAIRASRIVKDEFNADLNVKGSCGQMSLHLLVNAGDEAEYIVLFLIDNGVDGNAKEDFCDRTPLHMSNSPIITQILIDKSVDGNEKATIDDFH